MAIDAHLDTSNGTRSYTDATTAVRCLLEHVGEDPGREGLVDTPRRLVNALVEMTGGYDQDPVAVLGTTFTDERYDEMVLVTDVPFSSLCEHHVLPFTGTATIGYIPAGGKIVGLSKLPRLLHVFARRLQVQERLTTQVADTINQVLSPMGVGVVVTAHHTCMGLRGVRSPGTMVTSALLGKFRDDPMIRDEFLRLAS
mgnify:CR=1 FL=1